MRYYSNSEFQTFKECRRKWWLGWHRRLRPRARTVVSPASLGTLVHKSLAALYVPEGQDPADPRQALEELIRADRADVIAAYAEDPQGADAVLREMDKQSEYARAMIEGYVDWLAQTGVDSEFEVMGSEQVVQYEISPGRTLIGRLDVRVRRLVDGVRLFLDHKTCANFPDLQRSLPNNEQMQTYLILDRLDGQTDTLRADGAIFNGLRKVKRTASANPPFYARFSQPYNESQLTSMWNRIQGTAADIERAEDRLGSGEAHQLVVYPRPSRDCHWKCEFYPVCDMFDDGSRAEDMLANIYEVADPLDRYPELRGEKEDNDD